MASSSLDMKLNVVIGILVGMLIWHMIYKKQEKYDYTQGDLSPKLGAISTWDTDWTRRWNQVVDSEDSDMIAPVILNQQVKPCDCPKCSP
jgi:hypothetical protein